MGNFEYIAEFGSSNRGLYYDGNLIIPFKSEQEVKESHNLYIYVDKLDNGNIVLKFGKAKDSIYERYKNHQDIIKPSNKCIWLGDSEYGDEYGHAKLQELAKIHKMYIHITGKEANNTDENYEMIYGIESIKRFIEDVESIYNTKNSKEDQPLYEDIFNSVKEVFLNNVKWNILYYCPRAGKTRTNISLMQLHNMINHRISIMFSYVGTVRNSYIADLNKIKGYENIKFIDVDEIKNVNETTNEINKWLENSENHIMIYFALTGDTGCFNRRTQILNKLNKYNKVVFIEEADFGAHCENSSQDNISQLKKIHSIVNKYNVENIYVTTGTGYEKLLKFVSNENYKVFTKDYFVDILGE